jgi:hypothetical protein
VASVLASDPDFLVQMADKLDVLMEELFDYMSMVHQGLQSAPTESRDHMFHVALAVFERSILLTHK